MGLLTVLQAAIETLDKTSRMRIDAAWEDPALESALPAVRRGEVPVALDLLAAAHDDYALRALRTSVLARTLEPRLEEVTARESDDADVLLLVGATRIQRAWAIRGGGYAKYVSGNQFAGFFEELGRADKPLHRAAELMPLDPTPWDQLQWHAIGSQANRRELSRIWFELGRRDPASFTGAYGRVQAISEKWHGSSQEAAAFADQLVAEAPPGTPAVAMAAAAHLEIVWRQLDGKESFATEFLGRHFGSPPIAGLMARAADRWMHDRRPHPQDIEAHHLLGAAFYFAGQMERARFHLAHTGRRIPRVLPWSVVAVMQGRYYRKVRRRLGL